MNAPQLLDKAIEEIKRCGWRQGEPGCGLEGPCCAGTALMRAAKHVVDVPAYDRARHALVNVLPNQFRENGGRIAAWNDDPSTTKKMVLGKLKEAAHSLRRPKR